MGRRLESLTRANHAEITRRTAIFYVRAVSPTRTTPVKLLSNNDTAELLGLKPNTLEIWRLQGKGPVFRKIGRLVRYVESDVLFWLDAQVHTSTSQYPMNSGRTR